MIGAQKAWHLTQKELAERTGINQADISKWEMGNSNSTLDLLKCLAMGMNMTLKVEFVPRQHLVE